MTIQTEKMGTGKAIAIVIGFILVLIAGIYFAYRVYEQLVLFPAEDARYEAAGCYISDAGTTYTCPNGLPD